MQLSAFPGLSGFPSHFLNLQQEDSLDLYKGHNSQFTLNLSASERFYNHYDVIIDNSRSGHAE